MNREECVAPKIPYLDSPVFTAGDKPFAFAMKLNGCNILRMTIKPHELIEVGQAMERQSNGILQARSSRLLFHKR